MRDQLQQRMIGQDAKLDTMQEELNQLQAKVQKITIKMPIQMNKAVNKGVKITEKKMVESFKETSDFMKKIQENCAEKIVKSRESLDQKITDISKKLDKIATTFESSTFSDLYDI